jgi:hypothetical protein
MHSSCHYADSFGHYAQQLHTRLSVIKTLHGFVTSVFLTSVTEEVVCPLFILQVLTVLKLQQQEQQEQQELPRPRIRASSSSTMRQQGPCLCPARCWVGAQ